MSRWRAPRRSAGSAETPARATGGALGLLPGKQAERENWQSVLEGGQRMKRVAVEVAKAIVHHMGGRSGPPQATTTSSAPAAVGPASRRVKRRSPLGFRCDRSGSGACQGACQEVQPDASDRAPADAHRLQAGGPARQKPEGDAGQMEQSGRDHEADAVGQRVSASGSSVPWA